MYGLSMSAIVPSMTSPRLCGGMLVAMPTAIPDDPLTRSWGNLAGRTVGSLRDSSKFGMKSTVSLSMSASIWEESFAILTSVYLCAAGGSPSTDPKLPWPSTSMLLNVKSCAILTMASYTAISPCGWYLPMTSPTTVADFLCGFSPVSPSVFIA